MTDVGDIVADMKNNPANIRFNDAKKVAEHYFGAGRQAKGSHLIFRMPWPGNPHVNLQNDGGKAKAYQVRQLLEAIAKTGSSSG